MIKTHKEKQSLPRAFYLLWSTVDSWLHHHSFREKKLCFPTQPVNRNLCTSYPLVNIQKAIENGHL